MRLPHPRLLLALALVVGAGLVAGACGSDRGSGNGSASEASRTIDVDMVDIAFEPDAIEVKKGETVTFRFKNVGKVAHDAFIGDAEEQAEHEEEMGDEMAHHANAEGAVTVDPGETKSLTYTFDDDGDSIEIGCHQPGHYAAGMRLEISVA